MKDFIIIGAGPAGLSAALYGARAGLDFMIIESNYMAGGQVLNTYEVDNYLGLPDSNGFDMGMKFKEHAEKLGVEIVSAEVSQIDKTEKGFLLHTSEGAFACKSVIMATGAVNSKLNIPGEEEFRGRGVGYCATCDGALYRGKITAVIGGSYQAVEDAVYLSALCKKVYLIHRRDALRAGAVLERQLFALPNVEIIWDTVPLEILGTDVVENILVKNLKSGKQDQVKVDGVFVAIGTTPTTELAKGLVDMDEKGYIIAGEDGVTSLKGFFAAGDIRTKHLRQIVTAVADGANAVTSAATFLKQ